MRAPVRTTILLIVGLLPGLTPTARADEILGRSPRPALERIVAGPFVQRDIDDILALESIGALPAALRPGLGRNEPGLFRLCLFRPLGGTVREVWRSRPLLADPVPAAMLAPNAWTAIDLDGDGLLELAVFSGERCEVWRFGPDSVTSRELSLPGAWVTDAVAADLDDDGRDELVTLEAAPTDSLLAARLVRVYAPNDTGFSPLSDYLTGLFWREGTDVVFTGSIRLPDYPGRLPVVAGIRREPGPSPLAVLYLDDDGQYRFTGNPFPLREWFAREETLPGGRLVLANQGDSLVAYGFFVPGSRPGGPARSFAGLEDGAWRLLAITDAARQLGWPACPVRLSGRSGWLELRNSVFRFHADPVVRW
ncbi:MAG: FG-GAP-like repeat-containing protein [bacterium]